MLEQENDGDTSLRLLLSDVDIARDVSVKLHAIFADLENTLRVVEKASPNDLHRYRRAIGQVCAALVLDVMAPIYKQHPSIRPENWPEV